MRRSKNHAAITWLRIGVLAAAVCLIGAGLMRREHLEVLTKAVRICLECIGIG